MMKPAANDLRYENILGMYLVVIIPLK